MSQTKHSARFFFRSYTDAHTGIFFILKTVLPLQLLTEFSHSSRIHAVQIFEMMHLFYSLFFLYYYFYAISAFIIFLMLIFIYISNLFFFKISVILFAFSSLSANYTKSSVKHIYLILLLPTVKHLLPSNLLLTIFSNV